jgi:hypothetical protein
MSWRWRRSPPTEKALSPAPVMMTTLISRGTEIDSTIFVRRAPISVVIAFGVWRFSVMTATRSRERYSTSTG